MLTALFHSSAFGGDCNTIIDALHTHATPPRAYQVTCDNLLRAKRFITCFMDDDVVEAKDKSKKSKERARGGVDPNSSSSQLKSVTEVMNDTGRQIFRHSFAMLAGDVGSDSASKSTKSFLLLIFLKPESSKAHYR